MQSFPERTYTPVIIEGDMMPMCRRQRRQVWMKWNGAGILEQPLQRLHLA